VLRGPPAMPMTDAQYCDYLESQEAAVDHSRAAIELLRVAHGLYTRLGPARPARLLYRIGGLMATEYLAAGDVANAAKLLEGCAALQRQEGWRAPLAATLAQLRDCALRRGATKDYVAASLELSALVGYVSDEVAEAAGEDAVAAIEAAGTGPAADTVPASMGTSILAPTPAGFSPLDSAGTPEAPTSPGEQQSGTLNAWRSSDAAPSAVEESAAEVDAAADALKAADLSSSSPTAGAAASSKRGPGPVGGAAVKAGLHRSESTPAMHFTVGAPPDGAGLSSALALSVGFAKPDAFPTAHLGRDGAVTIGVGIWSGLTAPLVETRVEVVLEDRTGQISLDAVPAPELLAALGHTPSHALLERLGSTMPLTEQRLSDADGVAALQPQAWATWAVRWAPRHAGPLRLRRVVLYCGTATSFTWQLPEAPQGQAVIGQAGSSFGSSLPPFRKASDVEAGLWTLEAPSRLAAPELKVHCAGYGMVGERLALEVASQAGAAVAGGTLTVTAAYREGLCAPQLLFAPARGVPAGDAEEEAAPVKLAAVEAGARTSNRYLLALPRHGQIRLTATLTCNLAEALENTVTMSVALELTVEQPFSVTTTLAGPPRVPQLLLPSGGLSTAAALGGGGVEGRAALPLRSRCMLTAALRATAPCEVIIESCALELPEVDPGEPPAVLLPNGPSDLALPAPANLRTGDIHSALFSLTSSTAAHGMPLGSLLVRWRRALPAQKRTHSSSQAAPPGSPVRRAPQAGVLPPPPGETVATRLPLPVVDFAEPLLSVTADHPSSATAGTPFRYQIVLDGRNCDEQQQLMVALGDTTGWVLSGPRKQALSLLPRMRAKLAWQLVAVNPGPQPLPSIQVAVPGVNARVDASGGRQVFVLPAAIPV